MLRNKCSTPEGIGIARRSPRRCLAACSMPEGIGAVCGSSSITRRWTTGCAQRPKASELSADQPGSYGPPSEVLGLIPEGIGAVCGAVDQIGAEAKRMCSMPEGIGAVCGMWKGDAAATKQLCSTPEGIGAVRGGWPQNLGSRRIFLLNARKHRSCLRTCSSG